MSKKDVGDAGNLGDGGGGTEQPVVTEGVDVSEEVIWKARAEEAESKVEQLEAQVRELESALGKAEETIAQVERRGEIDRELTAAKVVDLETARLLTEAVIGEMDEPDVGIAVRELCERKPFLFGGVRHGVQRGVSMSPAAQGGEEDGLDVMAHRARSSGDRGELLRYLRARRVV
ncbi:MAG: hypothetical protein CMJ35_00240 [Phycisphaerae bacterium]|nr:hypothetical protein [Phycisphaerae bacterium]MBM90028.1 hypothetical protein [Phycisphaerae bacterium]HCT46249.1 hypothetical protein [Phycisphaerales bacterium]|tara:strand:- start:137 stop:661 length:525 start_codon:yes stop_codon:yes gene_type:complete